MSDEPQVSQPQLELSPENTTASEPSAMPPESPESPGNGDSAVPVNNDNSAINESEAIKPEIERTSEMPENQASSESQNDSTAQIPVNEPLAKPSFARELLVKARNAIQFRKRKKLDRVMSLFLKQSKITNDEVEKFLHVSDATATRYLSELEKERRIKQSGKTGHMVSYSRM